jgi:ribosome-associated heat shock protein Hsp15
MHRQRLDKWLWHARLTRTRTLAAQLIAAGKIRVNGERSLKASREISPGDVVTGMKAGQLFVVRVLGAADRRGSATLAQTLYEDLTPEQEDQDASMESKGPRPTKRDRRRIDAMRDRLG